MARYTVKQLADMARVSIRTLHHYDEIGLLKPAFVGDNGYRYYDQPQLYRLQQILLYREFGVPLEEIKGILDAPDFDVAVALRGHRDRLTMRLEQQQQILRVIDETLARLEDRTMQDNNLYNWNAPARQAEYEVWLVEHYGEQARQWLAASRGRFDALSAADKQAAMDRLAVIEADLAEAFRRGLAADAALLRPILESHRAWVAYMWDRPCEPGAYSILADMYIGHPDFVRRFDSMADGFAAWLSSAMKAHAAGLGEAAPAG